MLRNSMTVLGSVQANGYSQCYTCGFGHSCDKGNVVKAHGFLEKIEEGHLPPRFVQQKETQAQAKKNRRCGL